MTQTTRASLTFALACTLATPSGSAAQEPMEYPDSAASMEDREWSVSVTPYVILASQSADLAGEALRQSFSDVVSQIDVAFQGRIQARWRWLITEIDGTNAQLGSVSELGARSFPS